MRIFSVNGKKYNAKPFDFNMICDLEDMGITISDSAKKPMSLVRAYFGICADRGKEYAGKEMEAHIINGGNFDDVVDAMSEEMDESDFFRKLKEKEVPEITESPKQQETKK